MSTNLIWRPTPKLRTHKCVLYDVSLKDILCKKYSFGIDYETLDSSDIPYLEGLRDAGHENLSKEAQILINAILEYSDIDIMTDIIMGED